MTINLTSCQCSEKWREESRSFKDTVTPESIVSSAEVVVDMLRGRAVAYLSIGGSRSNAFRNLTCLQHFTTNVKKMCFPVYKSPISKRQMSGQNFDVCLYGIPLHVSMDNHTSLKNFKIVKVLQ